MHISRSVVIQRFDTLTLPFQAIGFKKIITNRLNTLLFPKRVLDKSCLVLSVEIKLKYISVEPWLLRKKNDPIFANFELDFLKMAALRGYGFKTTLCLQF